MLPTSLRGQKHTPIPPIIAHITKKVNTTGVKIFLLLTNKSLHAIITNIGAMDLIHRANPPQGCLKRRSKMIRLKARCIMEAYPKEIFRIQNNWDLFFPATSRRNFGILIPNSQLRLKRGRLKNQLCGVNLPIVSQAIELRFTGANLLFGQYAEKSNIFTIYPPEEADHYVVVVTHDVLENATRSSGNRRDGLHNIKNHSLRYCINEGVEERSYFILEFGERLVSNQTVADMEFRRKVAIEEYNRLRQGKAPTSPDKTLLGNFKSPNPSENCPYHSQRFKEQNAETLASYLPS